MKHHEIVAITVASIVIVAATAAASYYFTPGLLPEKVVQAVDTVTAPLHDPDKLGWLDDAQLTDSDRKRVAQITGSGKVNNLNVIRSMQAGEASSVTRRDFELLRQDRRRAQAAYPDVSHDDLYTGTWLQVDLGSRIPTSFCKSGNSNGTEVEGQDPETLNRGNLKEARCFQEGSLEWPQGLKLAERTLPILPQKQSDREPQCVQGGTLMPGQSCIFALRCR